MDLYLDSGKVTNVNVYQESGSGRHYYFFNGVKTYMDGVTHTERGT